jgi:hypothetical protein
MLTEQVRLGESYGICCAIAMPAPSPALRAPSPGGRGSADYASKLGQSRGRGMGNFSPPAPRRAQEDQTRADAPRPFTFALDTRSEGRYRPATRLKSSPFAQVGGKRSFFRAQDAGQQVPLGLPVSLYSFSRARRKATNGA